jgi:hypothetical protein
MGCSPATVCVGLPSALTQHPIVVRRSPHVEQRRIQRPSQVLRIHVFMVAMIPRGYDNARRAWGTTGVEGGVGQAGSGRSSGSAGLVSTFRLRGTDLTVSLASVRGLAPPLSVVVSVDALSERPVTPIGTPSVVEVRQQPKVIRPHAASRLAQVIHGQFAGVGMVMRPCGTMRCRTAHLSAFVEPADLRVTVTSHRVRADPALAIYDIPRRGSFGCCGIDRNAR